MMAIISTKTYKKNIIRAKTKLNKIVRIKIVTNEETIS